MNIWVIGRSYPTKKNSMRGSFELEQAHLLESHGHRVAYLAAILHPINKVKKWGFCHFKDGKIDIYTDSIFFAPERMHLHPKKLLIKVWEKLLSTAEKELGIPDIIHIHYPGMISIPEAVLKYQSRGTRIVTTDHWSKTLMNSMDSFQRNQLIEYANRADAVLCVSQLLQESIARITKTEKEIQIVPNVVTGLFSLEKTVDNKQERYDFVAVGRIAPVKQMDQIALAFAKEFAEKKSVYLTVVGGGKEKEISKIKKIIEEYHVEGQIHLTGTLSREETAKKVKNADSLVCFSQFETFGVPVIEAWACGKPVVGSDSLGFIEYWSEDLGYIVPHDDINALQKKMRQIYEKRGTYDAEAIARFAVENFGEEVVYEKLMKVYEEKQSG